MYYNHELKQEYLDNCKYEDTTIEVIKVIFNATEIVEIKWKKDLCFFNRSEIIDLLKSFNSKSRSRLRSTCVYLADYYNWCLYEKHLVSDLVNYYHYTLSNDIIELVIPTEELNDKYFNEKELLSYKDNVIDPSNKFIMYALYCGVKSEELINIKMSDYDEKTNELNLRSGRKINPNKLFYDLMRKANAQEMYLPDGIETDTMRQTNSYVDNGYVLKPCRTGDFGTPISIKTLSPRIATIKEQSGNEFISITTLSKNGMINYIKKHYNNKGITLYDAFMEKVNGKRYKYEEETQGCIEEFGSTMTVRMLRREIKDFLELLDE